MYQQTMKATTPLEPQKNMTAVAQIPDLEDRFLEPDGWRWHYFKRNGRKIRFGSISPKTIPHAVVVCLPGLGEFSEKYFEVARTINEHNMAFWIMDWVGQGKSDRYLKNPQKRHSIGFQHDVDDLHDFILGYIKHSSVHPDVGRIPLAMLGHSMGANIGLHYLHKHPDTFECAGFTAPMFGLKVFKYVPWPIDTMTTGLLNLYMDTTYVVGGSDWREKDRANPGKDAFSGDPVRGAVHNAWCLADPELQVGRITYGWLHEAARACINIQDKEILKNIQTDCLFACAGKEKFADNYFTKRAASLMPNVRLLELPESRHEILMEKDEIRASFFESFSQLVKETIIDRPETLKPF